MDDTHISSANKKPRVAFKSGAIYTLIRRAHLYTGLVLLTFVTMYFATGTVFIHANWYGENPPPVDSFSTHTLDADLDPKDPEFPARLQAQLGIPGRRSEAEDRGEGRWRVKYSQPGLEYTVDIKPDRIVKVQRRRLSFSQTLSGFHRMHGYGSGWFFNAWAFMLDLVSVSLIVFALTGMFMWWKLTKNHSFGWLLLAGGYGYATVVVVYLIAGP